MKIFFSLQEIFLFFPAQQSVLPHLRRRAAAAHTSRISRTNTRAYNGAVAARTQRKIIINLFFIYWMKINGTTQKGRQQINFCDRTRRTDEVDWHTGKSQKTCLTGPVLCYCSQAKRRKNGTSKSDGAGKRPSEWFRTVVSWLK